MASPGKTSESVIPVSGDHRKIAIAVDLSDESAYAVKWAVQNYLRPGDSVTLLHVRPTSVLYGADWGSVEVKAAAAAADGDADTRLTQKLEDDFDTFTTTKTGDLAEPLATAQIPFKIRIVKDHDMKERLCLEVERLGLSAVIMGSRGFGKARRTRKGRRLGSVSDYCVQHCVCPVVVVRYPDEEKDDDAGNDVDGEGGYDLKEAAEEEEDVEDDQYEDAFDKQMGAAGVDKDS